MYRQPSKMRNFGGVRPDLMGPPALITIHSVTRVLVTNNFQSSSIFNISLLQDQQPSQTHNGW